MSLGAHGEIVWGKTRLMRGGIEFRIGKSKGQEENSRKQASRPFTNCLGRKIAKYIVVRHIDSLGFLEICLCEKDFLKGKNASDLDQEMKNFRRKK